MSDQIFSGLSRKTFYQFRMSIICRLEYQLTLRGREAYATDRNHPLANEKMMLHNANNILVFASDLDLEILHGSEFWVGDGTLEMVPAQFNQLYSVHAFCNGEAVPCCHALLPNRTRATYDLLFTILRDSLIDRFGNTGSVHTVLMDFEIAAHNSVRDILQVQTRGCIFHFSQALIRKVQGEGFMEAYQNIPAVQQWIRLIKALALIPPHLVLPVWNQWLSHIPPVNDHLLQQKLTRFRTYFEVGLDRKSTCTSAFYPKQEQKSISLMCLLFTANVVRRQIHYFNVEPFY